MTVYRAKDRASKGGKPAFRYDFQYLGRRYVSPRTFPTKTEARDAEAARRRSLRRAAAGLEVDTLKASPHIADWAEVYMEFLIRRGRVSDFRTIETVLRVVLRFWGRKPDRELKPHEAGPYHDLRLRDPIDQPHWLLKFEEWIDRRAGAGSTRNSYRSAMSRLYAVALLPEYRTATGIIMNPFMGLLRDRTARRTVTLSLEQLRAIMTHAAPHLRLAIAIAALAPKLRLANVLGLQWSDIGPDVITVQRHKTARITGQPMVAPISAQLRVILDHARAAADPAVPWVIAYHRRNITKTVEVGLRLACEAAGVRYGLKGGATFHTIRHSAATLLAAIGVAEGLRKEVMGHRSISTTQLYTHLSPVHEVAPLELLSAQLPIVDLLVGTPVEVSPETARRGRTPTDADG